MKRHKETKQDEINLMQKSSDEGNRFVKDNKQWVQAYKQIRAENEKLKTEMADLKAKLEQSNFVIIGQDEEGKKLIADINGLFDLYKEEVAENEKLKKEIVEWYDFDKELQLNSISKQKVRDAIKKERNIQDLLNINCTYLDAQKEHWQSLRRIEKELGLDK